MEEIVRYLEAIEATNQADRARDPVQINRACESARSAWDAIPPNLQKRMSPPPTAAGVQIVFSSEPGDQLGNLRVPPFTLGVVHD